VQKTHPIIPSHPIRNKFGCSNLRLYWQNNASKNPQIVDFVIPGCENDSSDCPLNNTIRY